MNRFQIHDFIVGKPLDRETFFSGKVTRILAVIRVEDVSSIGYNPTHRSESGSKELRDSLKQAGNILVPLHLWAKDMSAIDGNGRRAELMAMGIKYCRAYIYDCDAHHRDLVYAMLNDSHRKHSGSDKSYVMAHGGPEMAGRAHKTAVSTVSKYMDPSSLDPFPAPHYVTTVEYTTNRIAQSDESFVDPKKRKELWLALFGYLNHAHEYRRASEELRTNRKRYFTDLKNAAINWYRSGE